MSKQHWEWEKTDRWIRAEINGVTIADSKQAMLMIENRGELDYYFPIADIKPGSLIQSEYTESSGYRGTKTFWHVQAGDKTVENAAWTYETKAGRPDFSGFVALKWDSVDHWYEEEEEVFLHPRHPYHRVDFVPSSRHVEVFVDEVKVADTTRPLLIFETTLPTRYYIPEEDVNFDYLQSIEGTTHCPYKGFADYYTIKVNGERYDHAAWTYPEPIPEAPRLKGKIAFWPEKDKRIRIVVDGE
ncbi:MAG: DUF427 domain-containing protein [Ardenticatenaceae bacterium]|nr:DUF427 domain-containing protein [Ardenticatenaceae bacterium]